MGSDLRRSIRPGKTIFMFIWFVSLTCILNTKNYLQSWLFVTTKQAPALISLYLTINKK